LDLPMKRGTSLFGLMICTLIMLHPLISLANAQEFELHTYSRARSESPVPFFTRSHHEAWGKLFR
jgi:hypothetical protein